MELDLIFTNHIKDDVFFKAFQKFKLVDEKSYNVLLNIQEQSYLDAHSWFFLINREERKFYSYQKNIIENHKNHINSIFYFINCSFFRNENIVFSNIFKYKITTYESFIIYSYLSLKQLLFDVAEKIFRNSELFLVGKREIEKSFLFNNDNLLIVSFLLLNKEQINKIINKDWEYLSFNKQNEDFDLHDSSEESVYASKVGYAISELKRKLGKPYLINHNLCSYSFTYIPDRESWIYLQENCDKLTIDFILDDLDSDFTESFLKEISIENLFNDFKYLQNDIGNKNIQNNEIKKLKNTIEEFSLNKHLRSCLKLKIPVIKVIELFDYYCDNILQKKSLKKKFNNLFQFLDSKIDSFPIAEELDKDDIKKLIRFFKQINEENIKKHKEKIFFYEVKNLIFLILSFANKLEEIENTSIEKAHRDSKFDLDSTTYNKLNSIVR